ncbi:MAG: CoA transferase [Mesorhizobium sp.]|uniref:CaiB/BaiF CoA transferase family protein n=1 Tax=Mesorhizobium sp. TaxID=1871066 RepID=UPI000FE5A0AB|nr:CaiB/BaiF CoA-transferase family protein [Mesorhizobium sp.]RWF73517.1 MAG: CoA transferase [Mesorhizobium sp.]TIS62785.1 MAG: CoA transferase [Mesorhizobium sp.]TIW50440.1 MAG: CoA transferase [Mesorhizobium sp.]
MTTQDKPKGRLPLEGIKVLDLSRVLAGPWATMSLSDLGAEVWKIENVDGGDDTRAWSVPSYKGVSTYYLCANRGKRSLALDIKSLEGLAIVRSLAEQCDVVVENFRVGTAERLGVGYEQLRAIRPDVVYCSISGYGRDTSEARRPGYDFIAQAESGLMAITGEKGGQPLRFGIAITDIACGMVATQSILGALFHRERTGEGQHIDVSLMDCALNLLINVGSGFLNSDTQVERYGNAHPTVVPYQIFDCSDGSFALAVGTDRQFKALCELVIGKPDLSEDPRFQTANARAKNREALVPILEEAFRSGSRQHWMEACSAAEVPAGIVKTVEEALNSRGVQERSMLQTLQNPHLGPVKLIRPAQGLAAQKEADYLAPPLLGQHTHQILKDVLGYSDKAIISLEAAGVISGFKQTTEREIA